MHTESEVRAYIMLKATEDEAFPGAAVGRSQRHGRGRDGR